MLPFCRFGQIEVIATVVNSTSLVCESPPAVHTVAVEVGLALRFLHTKRKIIYTSPSHALTFSYTPDPVVTTVAPTAASARGGSMLRLAVEGVVDGSLHITVRIGTLGAEGTTPPSHVDVSAVLASPGVVTATLPANPLGMVAAEMPVEVSNNGVDFSTSLVSIVYEAAVTVASLEPSVVPEDGNVTVVVMGSNFVASRPNTLRCRFGVDAVVAATWRGVDRVECVCPPGHAGEASRVSVSNNGVDFTTDDVLLRYRTPIAALRLAPKVGPARGGTTITVTVTDVLATDKLDCVFREMNGAANHGWDHRLGAIRGRVPATVAGRTSVTCVAPKLDLAAASTAVNGPSVQLQVVLVATRASSLPAGSAESRLLESAPLVLVQASRMDMLFRYERLPAVTGVHPKTGPSTGGTVVRVSGENFVDPNTSANGLAGVLVCRFTLASNAGTPKNQGAVVPATFQRSSLATCVAPAWGLIVAAFAGSAGAGWELNNHTATAVAVEVSTNGVDFSASGIPFYFHEPLTVVSVWPARGPLLGGMTIVLEGSHFPAAPSALETPLCRFGESVLVPAYPVAGTTGAALRCEVPPAKTTGTVRVTVSTNGQNFFGNGNFTYQAEATVYAVSPVGGPGLGRTTVTVTGAGFQNTTGLHCRFGPRVVRATFVSTAELRCSAPPAAALMVRDAVSGAVPAFTAADAEVSFTGSRVAVEVTNFLPAASVVAGSGSFSAAAEDDLLQFSDDGVLFTYMPAVAVTAVSPISGPAGGGTTVTLIGAGFIELARATLQCHFRGAGGEVMGAPVAAVLLDDRRMTCVTPSVLAAGQALDAASLASQVPASQATAVKVSLNGGADLSPGGPQFRFLRPVVVSGVRPDRGLGRGGTRVVVSGAHFTNETSLRCRFGSTYAPATFLSSEAVACLSPPHEAQSGEVQRLELVQVGHALRLLAGPLRDVDGDGPRVRRDDVRVVGAAHRRRLFLRTG